MSAIIHQFVVHQLAINEEEKLVLVPRADCFEVTPQIELLAQQVNQAFNTKPGKGVGGFTDTMVQSNTTEEGETTETSLDVSQFRQLLTDMLSAPDSFIDFSIKSSELLKKTLVDTGTVETGFVVFCQYEFLATKYLMIALINTKSHVEITKSLELSYSDHLDLAKMQLAVRVDLTQLEIQPELNRYISFIKGRMGRKVSDFFMQFIGCQELVDIKQQNKQLVTQVDEYLASCELAPDEKQESRTQVADYYKEKLDAGEDISVKELSGKLPSAEEQPDFYAFTQQSESPVEEEFQADKGVLKTLAKFSGQGGGVSISFDRKLYGDRISYNPDTDTLVVKGIPPNLKDQLSKITS